MVAAALEKTSRACRLVFYHFNNTFSDELQVIRLLNPIYLKLKVDVILNPGDLPDPVEQFHLLNRE